MLSVRRLWRGWHTSSHVGVRGVIESVQLFTVRFFGREDHPACCCERVRIDKRSVVCQIRVQRRRWLDGIFVGDGDSRYGFRVRSRSQWPVRLRRVRWCDNEWNGSLWGLLDCNGMDVLLGFKTDNGGEIPKH